MLGLNTINAINQLEKLRNIMPTRIARGAVKIITGVLAAPVTGFINGLFSAISRTWIPTCSAISVGTAIYLFLNNPYGLDNPRLLAYLTRVQENLIYEFPKGFVLANLFLAGYESIINFPVNYNSLLPHVNSKFFNSFRATARSYLSEINIFIKNGYFDNGRNISAKKANHLYQSFQQFSNIHNGFNMSAANDPNAFLEFLAKNYRFDDLYVLKQLGAEGEDCENKVAAVSCGIEDRAFPVSKSLMWQAAKIIASSQYTKEDLVNRGLNENEINAVEVARKFTRM